MHPSDTTAASGLEPPTNSVQAWMDDGSDMLLGNQEVLEYASFSDDTQSPLQSYSSPQHSPILDPYAFPDIEPLVASSTSAASAILHSAMAFQALANPVAANVTTSACETARQAALLHAYLTSQDEFYRAQLQIQQQQQQQRQQWNDFSALALLDKGQKQRELDAIDKEQEKQPESSLTQKADAENLARYLAQLQQIKEEDITTDERPGASRDEAMELADDAADPIHCPPSPSSSVAERSPSPEIAASPQQDIAVAKGTANSTAAAAAASASLTMMTTKLNITKPSRQLVCYNCQVTQTPLWRRTPDRKHSLCNACGLYYKQYGAHRPLNVRHKLSSVLIDPRLAALPYARPPTQGTRGSSPSGAEPSSSLPSSSSPPSSSSSSSSSDSDSEEYNVLPDLTKFYADALLRPVSAKKTSPPLMTAKQGIACANCSQTQTPLWRKNDMGEPICNACGLYAKLHNRARPVTMRKTKITRRRRDWGGNLAHQAKAQAQALALFHAQVQAQIEVQMKNNSNKEMLDITLPSSWSFENDHEEDCDAATTKLMKRRQKINGHGRHTSFSDSEEEPSQLQSQTQTQTQSLPKLQPRPQHRPLAPAPPMVTAQSQLHPRLLAPAQPSAPVQSQSQEKEEEPQEQQHQQQTVAQKLTGNLIMDEDKFADIVEQMNAHQMNRFLSVLESRCGVLRNRILACTEGSDQSSSFDCILESR